MYCALRTALAARPLNRMATEEKEKDRQTDVQRIGSQNRPDLPIDHTRIRLIPFIQYRVVE